MPRLLMWLLLALPIAATAQDGAPAAADAAPASAPEPSRDAPAIGRLYAGIGVASSVLSPGSADGAGAGWRFRLGVPRSRRLMLGVEAGLVSGSGLDVTWYDVGVTFFPWERYLYLRGAAGLSLLSRYEAARPGDPPFWSSEQGPNLLVGLGVALGRPRGLTVTLNVDGQTHFTSRGGGAMRSVSAASFWLGVDWY